MPIPLRLLLVEDSEDDAALLVRELQRGGFDVISLRVDTEISFKEALALQQWDLVISDYSMPHFSGLEAMKILRARGVDVPFIFISGTIGEEMAVAALKQGAQDYLMKSNLKRLIPAVRRELREHEEQQQRKHLESQVRQLQRFEAIGRLAGGIAHDFNNVLGAILGWADLGMQEVAPSHPTRQRFLKIRTQAERAAGLTRQLLAFARRQILAPRNIDLNEIITESLNLLQRVIGEQIEIVRQLAPDLRPVWADSSQVEQVIMNLCLNARDAMPDGGSLRIETRNAEISQNDEKLRALAAPGHYVLLLVSDTGTGMGGETLEHIFEPFFTTKETGKGTGLGLATVYGIVQQHHGCILVDSELAKGTTFRVFLPVGTGPVDRSIEKLNLEPQRGTETILVAEDHAGLGEAGRELLERLGYRVLLAVNGEEALRIFKREHNSIDLVLLDTVMPVMSGPEAYQKMKEIDPQIRAIFATGHVSESSLLDSAIEHGLMVLQKPYDSRLLGLKIRAMLDQRAEHS